MGIFQLVILVFLGMYLPPRGFSEANPPPLWPSLLFLGWSPGRKIPSLAVETGMTKCEVFTELFLVFFCWGLFGNIIMTMIMLLLFLYLFGNIIVRITFTVCFLPLVNKHTCIYSTEQREETSGHKENNCCTRATCDRIFVMWKWHIKGQDPPTHCLICEDFCNSQLEFLDLSLVTQKSCSEHHHFLICETNLWNTNFLMCKVSSLRKRIFSIKLTFAAIICCSYCHSDSIQSNHTNIQTP